MADDVRKVPGTGALELAGAPPTAQEIFAAETWQFFAFVFAAAVTLLLALLDEVPDPPWHRMAAKGLVFFGLGYLVLVNVTVRVWLATVLPIFKRGRRS